MARSEVTPKPEAELPTPEETQQRDLAPKPEETPQRSLVEPAALSVVDEFHGQGGSYLLDPATGIRTLVERTKSASL
jgi:hypothetical protein